MLGQFLRVTTAALLGIAFGCYLYGAIEGQFTDFVGCVAIAALSIIHYRVMTLEKV